MKGPLLKGPPSKRDWLLIETFINFEEISELAAPRDSYNVCNECDHAVLQATDLW